MSTESRPMTAPPTLYAAMYPELVRIAKSHGYALAVHGSMTRDFDLVAVPWTEAAGDPQPMIDEMKGAMGGVYLHHDVDHLVVDGRPSEKPHGRRAWSIHLTTKGSDGPYIDLSVMPRVAAPVAGGKNCPNCRDADSWGIADRASCAGCIATPDGKGSLYQPLNGPRAR